MTPAKGDRAAPPPPVDGYSVRFADRTVGDGWEQLCKQFPGPMRTAYQLLAEGPHPAAVTQRHHPLKAEYAHREHGGQQLAQWQYEVAGAARIWYVVEHDRRTVWITYAATRHPAGTDKGKVRR